MASKDHSSCCYLDEASGCFRKIDPLKKCFENIQSAPLITNILDNYTSVPALSPLHEISLPDMVNNAEKDSLAILVESLVHDSDGVENMEYHQRKSPAIFIENLKLDRIEKKLSKKTGSTPQKTNSKNKITPIPGNSEKDNNTELTHLNFRDFNIQILDYFHREVHFKNDNNEPKNKLVKVRKQYQKKTKKANAPDLKNGNNLKPVKVSILHSNINYTTSFFEDHFATHTIAKPIKQQIAKRKKKSENELLKNAGKNRKSKRNVKTNLKNAAKTRIFSSTPIQEVLSNKMEVGFTHTEDLDVIGSVKIVDEINNDSPALHETSTDLMNLDMDISYNDIINKSEVMHCETLITDNPSDIIPTNNNLEVDNGENEYDELFEAVKSITESNIDSKGLSIEINNVINEEYETEIEQIECHDTLYLCNDEPLDLSMKRKCSVKKVSFDFFNNEQVIYKSMPISSTQQNNITFINMNNTTVFDNPHSLLINALISPPKKKFRSNIMLENFSQNIGDPINQDSKREYIIKINNQNNGTIAVPHPQEYNVADDLEISSDEENVMLGENIVESNKFFEHMEIDDRCTADWPIESTESNPAESNIETNVIEQKLQILSSGEMEKSVSNNTNTKYMNNTTHKISAAVEKFSNAVPNNNEHLITSESDRCLQNTLICPQIVEPLNSTKYNSDSEESNSSGSSSSSACSSSSSSSSNSSFSGSSKSNNSITSNRSVISKSNCNKSTRSSISSSKSNSDNSLGEILVDSPRANNTNLKGKSTLASMKFDNENISDNAIRVKNISFSTNGTREAAFQYNDNYSNYPDDILSLYASDSMDSPPRNSIDKELKENEKLNNNKDDKQNQIQMVQEHRTAITATNCKNSMFARPTTTTMMMNKNAIKKIPEIYTEFNPSAVPPKNFQIFNNIKFLIFGKICFKFLDDNCKLENCFHSHIMPSQQSVRIKLVNLNEEKLNMTLINVFQEKKMLKHVINAIKQCNQFTNPLLTSYITFFQITLTKLGLSEEHVIRLLLDNIKHDKQSIKLLFFYITKTESKIDLFSDDILSFMDKYKFNIKDLNTLIDFCLNYKFPKLCSVVFKIFQKFENLMSHVRFQKKKKTFLNLCSSMKIGDQV